MIDEAERKPFCASVTSTHHDSNVAIGSVVINPKDKRDAKRSGVLPKWRFECATNLINTRDCCGWFLGPQRILYTLQRKTKKDRFIGLVEGNLYWDPMQTLDVWESPGPVDLPWKPSILPLLSLRPSRSDLPSNSHAHRRSNPEGPGKQKTKKSHGSRRINYGLW